MIEPPFQNDTKIGIILVGKGRDGGTSPEPLGGKEKKKERENLYV